MPKLEPLVGPAAGELISNPTGRNFCTTASGALKVKAVRTLRSVAESFSLSSARAGETASTKAAIKRRRMTSSLFEGRENTTMWAACSRHGGEAADNEGG